jgi:hypothetical protein
LIWSSWKVSITIGILGIKFFNTAAASIPLSRGIAKSNTTKSGFNTSPVRLRPHHHQLHRKPRIHEFQGRNGGQVRSGGYRLRGEPAWGKR